MCPVSVIFENRRQLRVQKMLLSGKDTTCSLRTGHKTSQCRCRVMDVLGEEQEK
jgi:hypothetical protein